MLHSAYALFVIAIVILSHSATALSADWPMWRNDVQRSGTTTVDLPKMLRLQWTNHLPAPQPAWPNEARLHFDASYEPIVLGTRMFVGSMLDGSMTAFDTVSGKALWRFYTNGPVRLAPVAFDGRVYFGSDDGWLYCVGASDGKLHWKVSGAPENRPRYRHLGNARLVSFWPVRGGPVVEDGVVYIGSGIWPTLGVFVRAVDAKSGKVIWTNDDSHAIENVRVDHNYVRESGISPQGHMLIQGNMLIVPNGRSMPARIDRRSGKLQYFVQGYRNGDSRVVVSGDIALVGRTGVVNLVDGREIASRWAEAGKNAPAGWSSAKVDLFEGPLFQYKFQPSCDYRSAIDGGIAYGVDNGTVFAYDLKAAKTSLQKDKQFSGKDIKPARWDAPELWSLKTSYSGKKQITTAVLKAGGRLYAHSGRNLFCVELNIEPTKPGVVAWTQELASEPTSMIAANDRLFVATQSGDIHCFGADKPGSKDFDVTLANITEESTKITYANKVDSKGWTEFAQQVSDAAESKDGYAIVAGLSNGGLVAALMDHSKFHVIAVDSDWKLINALRNKYGADARFQAIVDDPSDFNLPPYIANLIVTENVQKLKLNISSQLTTFYSSLRPYGGALCLPHENLAKGISVRDISAKDFANVKTTSTDDLLVLHRTGALPGSSIWSHETGDAARSFYSRDDLVKAPLAVLWYGDGRDHGFYKRKDYGHGLKPQVAGGRLFALQVATNTLKSVDAYTGRLLWSRKLGGSARYASMPDGVFVADQRTCLVLDPATGEPQHTFKLDVNRPADVPVSASDIRVEGDIVLIAVRFNKENAISKGRWNSELIIALDRTTGKQLWSRPAEFRYNTAAIAVSGKQVFLIDSHSPEEIGLMRRRGKKLESLPSVVLALDARSGREIWKTVREDPPATLTTLHFMSLRTQDDWLSYSTDTGLLIAGKASRTFAINGETGKQVWEKPIRGQQPLILGPATFINQTGHTYKVGSGDLVSGSALFRRGGCNYAVGGKNLLFLRSNCATYVDIDTKQEYAIRNLRSGCSNSLVAADGLLNAPCFSVGCVCNYPIQTSFAMFHLPESAAWHGQTPLKQ
jgi:outer membrane protein assembly factor BamB